MIGDDKLKRSSFQLGFELNATNTEKVSIVDDGPTPAKIPKTLGEKIDETKQDDFLARKPQPVCLGNFFTVQSIVDPVSYFFIRKTVSPKTEEVGRFV